MIEIGDRYIVSATDPITFTADRVGRYEVACAELCGLGHQQMRTFLEVLEPEEYEKRMREELDALL